MELDRFVYRVYGSGQRNRIFQKKSVCGLVVVKISSTIEKIIYKQNSETQGLKEATVYFTVY